MRSLRQPVDVGKIILPEVRRGLGHLLCGLRIHPVWMRK
jgi:hypothetical protein